MAANEPKKHHYVPQFYMRRFACADDVNKVMVLERHRDVVVADRKSIEGIGYEEHLHDYEANGLRGSIERPLNRAIETPFSESPTWLKISGGNCANLDETDRLPIYGFARHLQLRNPEMLQFIEKQHARYLAGELEDELTEDERAMYAWITANPGAAHTLFRTGAMQKMLPADASCISVTMCQAPIALRSSTNPAVRLSHPGRSSVLGSSLNSVRTWWLALDRHWGAFIMAGGPPGFMLEPVPMDFARVVNRQYLVQFLEGNARYLIAEDEFLGEDLECAGFSFAQQTTRGYRYRKT